MTEHHLDRPGATQHERRGEQSMFHRREFAAPAALVQRAHTERDLFARWMGPRGTTVRIDRFEPVTGGSFRYVVEASDGSAWAFHGSYHEVADGQIVHTWEYEDEPGPTLETLRFVDLDGGRSVLEVTSTYTSKQACDAMVQSGMDSGMDEDFERLDAALVGATS